MAVDVVVINYKTNDLLQNFIASYEEHKFDGCSLTVVDVEKSTFDEPSGVVMAGSRSLDYSYFSTRDNVGYGTACNMGARYGINDVILLANADTLLSDGFEECYNALMLHEDWGVLGPRQVDERNHITAGGIFGHDRAPKQRGWNEFDRNQYNDVREDALSVSGSLYFIKRSVWQELTLCEEFEKVQPNTMGAFLQTPHYFEETFCSYHARAHGFKVVYYGPVKMVHLWHRASNHGSWADRQFGISQQMHREACAVHAIVCE